MAWLLVVNRSFCFDASHCSGWHFAEESINIALTELVIVKHEETIQKVGKR